MKEKDYTSLKESVVMMIGMLFVVLVGLSFYVCLQVSSMRKEIKLIHGIQNEIVLLLAKDYPDIEFIRKNKKE